MLKRWTNCNETRLLNEFEIDVLRGSEESNRTYLSQPGTCQDISTVVAGMLTPFVLASAFKTD